LWQRYFLVGKTLNDVSTEKLNWPIPTVEQVGKRDLISIEAEWRLNVIYSERVEKIAAGRCGHACRIASVEVKH